MTHRTYTLILNNLEPLLFFGESTHAQVEKYV